MAIIKSVENLWPQLCNCLCNKFGKIPAVKPKFLRDLINHV